MITFADFFFPFGEDNGDVQVPSDSVGHSQLTIPLVLFNNAETSIYVSALPWNTNECFNVHKLHSPMINDDAAHNPLCRYHPMDYSHFRSLTLPP